MFTQVIFHQHFLPSEIKHDDDVTKKRGFDVKKKERQTETRGGRGRVYTKERKKKREKEDNGEHKEERVTKCVNHFCGVTGKERKEYVMTCVSAYVPLSAPKKKIAPPWLCRILILAGILVLLLRISKVSPEKFT